MALSLELARRLHNAEEPPAKRLCLAHAAFESPELPIQRKEEVILNWICTEEDLDRKSPDMWNTLLSCIRSDRLKNINTNDVKPSVKSLLIKIFRETLENENESSSVQCSLVFDCALGVLENSHFEHVLKKSPEEFFGLVSATLKYVSEEKKLISIIDNIISSYEKSLQKQHFCQVFVRQTLFLLVEAYDCLKSKVIQKDTCVKGLHMKTLKSFQIILFPKQHLDERLKFLNALFITSQQLTVESSLNELTNLLLQLSYGLLKLPDNVVISIYSLIFEAFYATHKKQNVALFQFVVMCSYLVGFSPKVKRPNGDICLFGTVNFSRVYEGCSQPVSLNQVSFKVMNAIVKVLKKLEISLEGTVRSVSFTQWLHALFQSVFSDKKRWNASTECLELLHSISDLCPFAAESQIYNVLWHIMLAKKDTPELLQSYAAFMIALCDLFTKISSLPKFLNNMLNMLAEKMEANVIESRSVEDIVPIVWCKDLHVKMSELPSSQCLVVLDNFVNQLLQNCVTVLEDNVPDTKLELFSHILSKLLCSFLNGVKLATYSVPLGITSKFREIMEQLKHVLGRLGSALLNHEHNVPVLEAFLDMGYNWGEVNVILIHYVTKDKLDVIEDDTSASSLGVIHSYMTNDQWNLISERIINFGDASCHSKMKRLIMQKLEVMKLFHENINLTNYVCKAATKYLLKNYTPCEIFNCVTKKKTELLLTFLDDKQLLFVAKQCLLDLFDDCESFDDKVALLKENQVFEMRDFTTVFIGLVVSKVAKTLSDKHTKYLLSSLIGLNTLSLLKNNELKNISMSLGKSLYTVLSMEENKDSHYTRIDEELLKCYLRLLMSLPVSYMHEDIQRLTVLSVLTVGWCINSGVHHSDAVKILYAELLLDIMEKSSNLNLTGYIHLGSLYKALVKHTSCLNCLKKRALFKHMFSRHLKDDESIKDLVPLITYFTANEENLKLYIDIISILLGMFSKKKRNNLGNLDSVYKILIKPLKKLVFRSLKSGNVSVLDVMEPYSLLLCYYLHKNKKIKSIIWPISEALDRIKDDTQNNNNSMELLLTVLKYRTKLSEFLPKDFVTKVWNSVMILPSFLPVFKTLLIAATKEEFNYLLNSLMLHTKNQVVPLSHALSFWKVVLEVQLDKDMIDVRQQKACELCHYLLESRFFCISEVSKQILLVEEEMTKNLKVIMEPHMIDLCFVSISEIQECEIKVFAIYWSGMLKVLSNLIHYRSALILERVPGFVHCVHILFTSLARRSSSHMSLSIIDIECLAQCGSSLARLFSFLSKHTKDFKRVSVYLLASCLIDMEKYPPYKEVKVGLMSCIHCLMSMCDHYSVSFLLRVLPSSTAELFNIIYKGYKKFVRFQGRV